MGGAFITPSPQPGALSRLGASTASGGFLSRLGTGAFNLGLDFVLNQVGQAIQGVDATPEVSLPGGNLTEDASARDLQQLTSFELASRLQSLPEFSALDPLSIINRFAPPPPRNVQQLLGGGLDFGGASPAPVNVLDRVFDEVLGVSLTVKGPSPAINPLEPIAPEDQLRIGEALRAEGFTAPNLFNLGRRPDTEKILRDAIVERFTFQPGPVPITAGLDASEFLPVETPSTGINVQPLEAPVPFVPTNPLSLVAADGGGGLFGGIFDGGISSGGGIVDRLLSAAPEIISAFRGGGSSGGGGTIAMPGGAPLMPNVPSSFLPSLPFIDAVPQNTPGASMSAAACITLAAASLPMMYGIV